MSCVIAASIGGFKTAAGYAEVTQMNFPLLYPHARKSLSYHYHMLQGYSKDYL